MPLCVCQIYEPLFITRQPLSQKTLPACQEVLFQFAHLAASDALIQRIYVSICILTRKISGQAFRDLARLER